MAILLPDQYDDRSLFGKKKKKKTRIMVVWEDVLMSRNMKCELIMVSFLET